MPEHPPKCPHEPCPLTPCHLRLLRPHCSSFPYPAHLSMLAHPGPSHPLGGHDCFQSQAPGGTIPQSCIFLRPSFASNRPDSSCPMPLAGPLVMASHIWQSLSQMALHSCSHCFWPESSAWATQKALLTFPQMPTTPTCSMNQSLVFLPQWPSCACHHGHRLAGSLQAATVPMLTFSPPTHPTLIYFHLPLQSLSRL